MVDKKTRSQVDLFSELKKTGENKHLGIVTMYYVVGKYYVHFTFKLN